MQSEAEPSLNGSADVQIEVGPIDPRNGGRRIVKAVIDGQQWHCDFFVVHSASHRQNFCDTVATKLGTPECNYLGSQIIAAADAADRDEFSTSETVEYERLTCKQLFDGDFQVKYLVRDVVPAGQGGVLSGRFKTLKTSTGMDLVVSAATATPFLDQFDVYEKVRSGIMSAEIAKPGLKELFIRVANAKGFEPADIEGLFFSTDCPKVGDIEHMAALERFIVELKLGLLLIDPSYLAFSSAGDSVSNVFAMGKLLLTITRLIEKTGCTIIILNHNRKSRANDMKRFDPPTLEEISMSGFAEWCRFYLLLGPQQDWDEETGSHKLWLRMGGSAGHAGLYRLNVVEGRRCDPGGRRWDVAVVSAAESIQADREQQERAKAERKEAERIATEERNLTKLLGTVARLKGGTKTDIKEQCGLNSTAFPIAWAAALSGGHIVKGPSVIKANKQPYETFKLGTGDTRDTQDN